MKVAAAEERYEDAARYRNRLQAIESLAARQAADKRAVGTADVIGLAVDGERRRGAGVPAPRRASWSTATRSTSRTSKGRTG